MFVVLSSSVLWWNGHAIHVNIANIYSYFMAVARPLIDKRVGDLQPNPRYFCGFDDIKCVRCYLGRFVDFLH